MNIAVLMKPVPNPDFYNQISIDPVTKRLNRAGVPTIINPSDLNALEYALQLKEKHGGKIIVLSMAPAINELELEKCLALGADEAYLISDRAFGGADTFSTSYTLYKGLEQTGFKADIILAGNESADGATSHVPPQLGEWLEWPHISNISSIEINNGIAYVNKNIETGKISYKVTLPALFSIHRGSNTPRLTTAYGIVELRNKKVNIYTKDNLNVDENYIGISGSPTQPGEIYVMEINRSSTELIGDEKQIASDIYKIISNCGIKKGGEQVCQ